MVRPWRPKRSRRNAQRAPGRTGPGCVMRGPLLVLGWPELSELEGCVGCRALAEHGLRSCRQTRLGGYASARRRLRKAGCQLPTGQGRGHVTCWTELVRLRRGAVRFRRVQTERRTGGTRTGGRAAARGGCAWRGTSFSVGSGAPVVCTVNAFPQGGPGRGRPQFEGS